VKVAVALTVVIALAGCGGDRSRPAVARAPAPAAPAPAPAPKLHARACPEVPGFRCATLSVPLHRRGPHARDGRRLTLDVAIQRTARAPRGDLLMLTGGPGQPGRPFGPRLASRLRSAAAGHRLVLIDQRGTGRNALRCPALQDSVGTSDVAVPAARGVAACARALGATRDAYATADTVADLDALRRALGDRRWTVGGVSYGTFVAERLALAHPGTIRALVLDSVVPQEGVELLDRVPLRATARVLGTVCAEPRAPCMPGTDPVADLRTVLRAQPALGPALLDVMTERSIGVPTLDPIPPALHSAATGDPGALDALLRVAQPRVPRAIFSTGLHAATLCADAPALWPGGPAAAPAVRTATIARLRATLPAGATDPFPTSTALTQGLLVTCLAWPPTPAPPAPAAGATIRAPTLLLVGDHDLSTPLEWARAQAHRVPGSRLVVVGGAGHSLLVAGGWPRGPGCAAGVPARALEAPGVGGAQLAAWVGVRGVVCRQ
jgi:pimeloyl-ACP methyl ester carboxylesterase